MDNIIFLFQEMIEDKNSSEKVIYIAKDLVHKFDIKSNDSIESLRDLAYWLYIFNQADKAKKICSIVDKEELDNNERNTWLRSLFILHCRILRESGDKENAKKYSDKVLTEYTTEQKLLRRLLKGSLLYDDKIKMYEDENNIERANAWKFLQFIGLCFIRELGGSDVLPIDIVEERISEIKNTLSTLS